MPATAVAVRVRRQPRFLIDPRETGSALWPADVRSSDKERGEIRVRVRSRSPGQCPPVPPALPATVRLRGETLGAEPRTPDRPRSTALKRRSSCRLQRRDGPRTARFFPRTYSCKVCVRSVRAAPGAGDCSRLRSSHRYHTRNARGESSGYSSSLTENFACTTIVAGALSAATISVAFVAFLRHAAWTLQCFDAR
jgi:hypothetical protein